jgi:EPS-associated MarR family transcriptional regulator
MLLGLPYVDYSIGAKAYRKEAILRYLNTIDHGSSYVIEIIYRAWRNRTKIIEIPVWCEVGKVNYCVSELARNGFIKIKRFKDSQNKFQYLYNLTPRGLEAKAGLTISFLKQKMSEYSEIKRQIKELAKEIEGEGLADISQDDTLDAVKRAL